LREHGFAGLCLLGAGLAQFLDIFFMGSVLRFGDARTDASQLPLPGRPSNSKNSKTGLDTPMSEI
jgi:hypothetical protein